MTNKPILTEKYDRNQVRVSGTVQRVWSSGDDILLRLLVQDGADDRFTLLLPGGCVNGQPVSLMKGDTVTAAGYLKDAPYVESGRQFAEKTRKGDQLLAGVPGLAEITSERMATYVVVQHMELVESPAPARSVTIEGVVSKVWSRQGQQFARLAVYDQNTTTNGRTGKDGRPWRQAHYVSVHFLDGKVGGRPVTGMKEKDRVRVFGRLSERHYSETLALFLLRSGQIGLLANAVNADELREVRSPRVSTYVVVDSLIQFTK